MDELVSGGRHVSGDSGGLAALTPNAVRLSPVMARMAEEPAPAATAIPMAPIKQAIAACQ